MNPDGVGCYKSTLQWYADKIEYMEERLEEGEQPLDVDSCKVQKALNTYANVYLICNQLANQDDQQGLLTSILSMMSMSG